MSKLGLGTELSWLEAASGGLQLVRARVRSLGRSVSLHVIDVRAGQNAETTCGKGDLIWRSSGELVSGIYKLRDLEQKHAELRRQKQEAAPAAAPVPAPPRAHVFNKNANGSKVQPAANQTQKGDNYVR